MGSADHDETAAGVVDVTGEHVFLLVAESAYAARDVGEDYGVVALEIDGIVGELVGEDRDDVDLLGLESVAQEAASIDGMVRVGVVDEEDLAFAFDEGNHVAGFVVEIAGGRRVVDEGGDIFHVVDGGVKLMDAGGARGDFDAFDVAAGADQDALGGFAVLEGHEAAVVGHGEIGGDVLRVGAENVNLNREGLAFLAPGGGDEFVEHDLVGDVVLKGHDVDGDVLPGGGGEGAYRGLPGCRCRPRSEAGGAWRRCPSKQDQAR